MSQTVAELFGAGATLSNGVLTIDFKEASRASFDLVNTPSNITAEQAADVIIRRFATLTAANDVSTSAIAAATTPTTDQFIATRGGTSVSQMRAGRTIYSYYAATNPTGDPDNLV